MEILLIYGGKSVEHEVSIKSAQFIKQSLINIGHTVKDLYITKDGHFTHKGEAVSIIPPNGFYVNNTPLTAACAFIIMHGAFGEDGRIQSLLELINIPYISTDSISSMLGMHKDLQYKATPTIAHLPYLCFHYKDKIDIQFVKQTLGSNLILKPEAGGSSVGLFHIKDFDSVTFYKCTEEIFTLDDRLIIQPYLENFKELMLGVYKDGDDVKVIGPGVMDCKIDVLDYERKYTENDIAIFNPQPQLDSKIQKRAQDMAIEVFKALGASFYARVDLFYHDGKLYLNEINTIPGFTKTSYFPRLLSTSIGIEKFLNLMIEESFKSFERQKGIIHG